MTRILVVDDNAADRQRMRRELARVARDCGLDVAVSEAASGDDAILVLQTDPPDLVLTDLSMPGFATGYVVQRAAERAGVRCEVMSGLPPLAPAYRDTRSKDDLSWVRGVVAPPVRMPVAVAASDRVTMHGGGLVLGLLVIALLSAWV